jgi:hypothetical protein
VASGFFESGARELQPQVKITLMKVERLEVLVPLVPLLEAQEWVLAVEVGVELVTAVARQQSCAVGPGVWTMFVHLARTHRKCGHHGHGLLCLKPTAVHYSSLLAPGLLRLEDAPGQLPHSVVALKLCQQPPVVTHPNASEFAA